MVCVMSLSNRNDIIRLLVRHGLGLPEAIKIYNYLSCNGDVDVSRETLDEYLTRGRGIDD